MTKEEIEEQNRIRGLLRNKYYWNNFVMKKKGDNTENQNEEDRILGLYQRFPLSEIVKESNEFDD